MHIFKVSECEKFLSIGVGKEKMILICWLFQKTGYNLQDVAKWYTCTSVCSPLSFVSCKFYS